MANRDAVIARLVTLAPCVLPRTKARLGAMTADGNASLAAISAEMCRDPLLTGAILGQANLAAPLPVLNPTQALLGLGFTTIDRILGEAIDVPEAQRRPLAQCWALGNATAVLMRAIADYRVTRLPQRPDNEILATLGMLHDLGTAVAVIHFTGPYAVACLQVKAGQGDLAMQLEQQLGLSPSGLGAALARAWNLPEPLATVMACYPAPMQAPEHLELTALTHVAHTMARALGFQAPGDAYLSAMDLNAVHVLGLGQSDLERILNRILDDLDEMDMFETQMLRS